MSKFGINFDNPPVVEAVCSVSFRAVDELAVPHIGLLWQRFKEEYPFCKEQPPLPTKIESYGEMAGPQEPTILIHTSPPLPRIWFFTEDERAIVQIQRDRLAYNWKRVRAEDKYPRFEEVYARFSDALNRLSTFFEDSSLPPVEPVQFELTYINHIPQGEGWESFRDVPRVFPGFNFGDAKNFLPTAEGFNCMVQYLLPAQQGRLYAAIQSALRTIDKRPVIQFSLTVKGIGPNPQNMEGWFDIAREWIVNSFVELTSGDVQREVWKRQ